MKNLSIFLIKRFAVICLIKKYIFVDVLVEYQIDKSDLQYGKASGMHETPNDLRSTSYGKVYLVSASCDFFYNTVPFYRFAEIFSFQSVKRSRNDLRIAQ